MRGHRVSMPQRRTVNGSIPADAGAPDGPLRSGGRSEVYPRGCGGTRTHSQAIPSFKGLSPRMRGHRPLSALSGLDGRSIPADAGAPTQQTPCYEDERVYPRGCGGTIKTLARQVLQGGLSPRMRGHRRGAESGSDRGGSIPADAGAPQTHGLHDSPHRVYPRGCGGTTPSSCSSF